MPDKSTNTTPRPYASNGRGTLGSTPLAASLEPTSSPDTRPTSAVGQPGAAMADGAREECTRETRSRRRLFAGAALGAISLAGLTLSLLLLVAPGILPGTGGAFPEGEASSTQSLFAGGFGGEDGADRDGAGTEGAFGDAASVNDETGATSDGAGTADASTAAPSANGAAADNSSEGNGRGDSRASAGSANAANGSSSGSSAGAGDDRNSGGSADAPSASSPSSSSGALGSSDASPSPAPASIAVSVVVDSSAAASLGFPATMASATLKLPEGATADDALAATGLSLEGSSSYVSAVNGLAEKMMGGTSGWTYTVNGTMPMTAASNYILHEGDAVRWVYVS